MLTILSYGGGQDSTALLYKGKNTMYNPNALTGMRTAHITTENGTQWSTSINGSNESIRRYFLGQYFDTGIYPKEDMSKVVNVAII